MRVGSVVYYFDQDEYSKELGIVKIAKNLSKDKYQVSWVRDGKVSIIMWKVDKNRLYKNKAEVKKAIALAKKRDVESDKASYEAAVAETKVYYEGLVDELKSL
jgi:hypothetical protein